MGNLKPPANQSSDPAPSKPAKPRFRGWVAPVVVVVMGVTMTVPAASVTYDHLEQERFHEMADLAEEAKTAVERRVESYVEILHGMRGLFAASEDVTRAEFNEYVGTGDLISRYPGFQALEFTKAVKTIDTESFEESVRNDTSLTESGYPDFTIHPATIWADRFVVDYVEPLEGNEAAFGFDLGTNPARRASVEQARDAGLPVATSGIQLVQGDEEGTGFLLLLAVYSNGGVPGTLADRREGFIGLVNGVFHVSKLLDDVLGANPAVDIEIYDAGPVAGTAALPSAESLLFDVDGHLDALALDAEELGRFTTFEVGGRQWNLYVHPTSGAFSTTSNLLAWVLLAGGLILTLVAAGLAYSLSRSRSRALALARKMTVDLEKQTSELRVARDDARAADQAKSRFLATVSHEIRNPIHGVLGASQLLMNTDLTFEQRDYLDAGTASANSLLSLINGILDLAKIEAGKFELEQTSFDVRRMMRHLVWEMGIQARGKGLELTHNVGPAAPARVIGDPTRLRQVLVNLIGNALKFTSQGGVHVEVGCAPSSSDQALLHFQVADTGIGIAEDKLDAIFASFEQADASVARDFGGTGLGLSIVSELVAMMDGQVWVESEEGAGSTFHFTAQLEVAAVGEATAGASTFGFSVLGIVASDSATRKVEKVAARLGWDLGVVDDFPAAKAGLQDGSHPEVIVIEEEVDPEGIESEIRALRPLTTSLIVLLARPGEPGDAARFHDAGAGVYLAGPISGLEISEAVAAAATPDGEWGRELVTRHTVRENLESLRILLADDSATNSLIISRVLGGIGHEVTVVGNGRLAVEAVVGESFDLVLMDVQMPEMDGVVATEKIRRWELGRDSRVPIVALTADAMQGDKERYMASGMDGFISKPFDADELVYLIAELTKDHEPAH